MAYDITHKNSTVAGTPPTASEVELGEIAINAADAELYVKDTNGNIRKFQNTTTGTAAGVQFTQTGTDAVQRTVESKLQDVVSVLDYIPQSEHAAIKGNTSVYDATDDIQAALATGKPVYFPAGTYITTGINKEQYNSSTYAIEDTSLSPCIFGDSRYTTTIQHKDNTTGVVVARVREIRNIKISLGNQSKAGVLVDFSSARIKGVQVTSKVYTTYYGYQSDLAADGHGIYCNGYHPLNTTGAGSLQGTCCGRFEDFFVNRINGTCLSLYGGTNGLGATVNDSSYLRPHLFTARHAIRIYNRAGQMRFYDVDIAEIGDKAVWISGGRNISFNGYYTANYGPPTSPNAWGFYVDNSIESVNGLSITNAREEQPSMRNYFANIYRFFIENGTQLFNCEFHGTTLYGNDAACIRGTVDIASRDDAGAETSGFGETVSLMPIVNRGESLKWVSLFQNEFRNSDGSVSINTFVPSSAGWVDYAFTEADIATATLGRPISFVCRKGYTDRIVLTVVEKGGLISTGFLVYANRQYLGAAGAGNAGGNILTLNATFNLFDTIEGTTKTGSSEPANGDVITIIPLAKAGGGSRYVYHTELVVRAYCGSF